MSGGGTIAVTGLKKVPIHLQSAQTRSVIKGGRIVNDDQAFVADIYIEDGLIKQVGHDLVIPGGTKTIDARGKLVLPGGIDARTHFELPLNGATSCDDFYSGTKAALAGGTTMIINTAMCPTGTSLTESYQKWRDAGDSKACCDFGLHVAVPKWEERTQQEMEVICRDGGVNSFKVMMGFKDFYQLSDAEMYSVFRECRNLGAIAGISVGNGPLSYLRGEELAAQGITGPEGLLYAASEEMDADTVSHAVAVATQANCPLFVDNVYSRAALEAVGNARRQGHVVFADTTAAALAKDGTAYFSKSWEEAANHTTMPPLRPDPSLPQYVMTQLASGDLQVASSDHRPFSLGDRALGLDNFLDLPHGVQGVEERMRIVWEKGVNQGLIDPCQFVAITSTNAAKIYNIYPKKGRIALGSDADLIIWDVNKRHTISASTHNQKAKYNIFEGISCTGGPVMIMSNGRVVLDDDGLHVTQGAGTFVNMNTNGLFTNLKLNQRERNYKEMKNVDRQRPNIVRDSDRKDEPVFVEKEDIIGMSAPKKQAVRVSNPPGGRTSFPW